MDADADKICRHAHLCLLDDGRVDKQELQYLLGLASADGNVTTAEKVQLAAVMDQIMATGPDSEVAGLVRRIRLALHI